MQRKEKLLREILQALKERRRYSRWGRIVLQMNVDKKSSWVTLDGWSLFLFGHEFPYYRGVCLMYKDKDYAFDDFCAEFLTVFCAKVKEITERENHKIRSIYYNDDKHNSRVSVDRYYDSKLFV